LPFAGERLDVVRSSQSGSHKRREALYCADRGLEREIRVGQLEERVASWLGKHWRLAVLLFWALTCALMIFNRWRGIYWFALPDTDDNMRIMQVRAWLHGQAWYDLRQDRLAPPLGANIHWSRIVDLPIAAIILLLKPIVGGVLAEKAAVAAAPLLPMLVTLGAMALATRRLLAPRAFILGLALLMCGHSARFMWTPLRIDHHGWQLAMLSLVLLSFTDRKQVRGGLILGGASAVALAIGLEMLVYLALAGALTVLLWIRDPDERGRLIAYGVSLAGATSLGYLGFASWDNSAPVCDALSPVWLSVMVLAGALAALLALLPLRTPAARLGVSALGGVLLVAAFAYFWPHCLGRPEGVSPEVEALWLSKVREARPLYNDDLRSITAIAGLPLAGLIGYAVMVWRLREDRDRAVIWALLGLFCLAAMGLLMWQSRAGPAAQVLAVPGAAALAWLILPRLLASKKPLVTVLGSVVAFLLISGIGPQLLAKQIQPKKSAALKRVDLANRRCPTLPALRPIALQPKGLVLTFVDLGPRLITVTHHDAIAGPYHRNGGDILDVIKTFRGSEAHARQVVMRRGVDYVLICPNLSESTVYRSEAPKGFYVQLSSGKVPNWLEPIELPRKSPYLMWRVIKTPLKAQSSPAPRQ
jgi:hypothetical protein